MDKQMTSARPGWPVRTSVRAWRRAAASIVAAGLALVSVVAGGAGAASAVDLSGNPFDGAAGFTAVAFDDAELSNHEIEGSVAVGGDVQSRSPYGPYNVIHKAAGSGAYSLPVYDEQPVRLVVGGTFDRAGSTQSIRVASGGYTDAATQLGRMTIGSASDLAIAPRGAGVCVQAVGDSSCSGSVIEQSAAAQTPAWTVQPDAFESLIPAASRALLVDWNAGIAAGGLANAVPVTLTGDFANPMNGLVITLTEGRTNVLDIDASAFPSGDWKLQFGTVKPSSTTPLVVNVRVPDGGNVNLPMEVIGQYPGGSGNNVFAPYMLWNIAQPAGSTAFLTGNGITPGSVLAPNSEIVTGLSGPGDTSADKTLIEGQIVADTLRLMNSGEVHHYGYANLLTLAEGDAVGGFSVRKALDGIAPGDLADGAATVFTVEYFLDGSDVAEDTTLQVTADGELVSGPQDLPVGTVVTFGEIDLPDLADGSWGAPVFSPSSVTIADGADTEVTLTNTFEDAPALGGFSVRKALAGIDVADLPDGAATVFTVEYFLDGSDEAAGTLKVTADGESVAGPQDLPVGTVVTFGEIDLPSLEGYLWGEPQFAPASVTIESDEQLTAVTLTNVATSTHGSDPVGGFSVRKALAGIDVADLPDGAATVFTVEYFLDGSDEAAGTLEVTADGEPVAGPQDLPVGTVVTFGEIDLPSLEGYLWGEPQFAPASVTIESDEQLTAVTLTNVATSTHGSDPVGGFSVRKALAGIDVADLPDGAATVFTVEYFLDGSDEAAGTLQVTADGEPVAGPQDLPLGTVVTFGEIDLPAVPDGTWAPPTFSPAAVTVTKDGQSTAVTLTNTFASTTPGDGGDGDGDGDGDGGDGDGDGDGGDGDGDGDTSVPDDDDSSSVPDGDDDGEELAVTGSSLVGALIGATAFVGAGAALVLVGRRRRQQIG